MSATLLMLDRSARLAVFDDFIRGFFLRLSERGLAGENAQWSTKRICFEGTDSNAPSYNGGRESINVAVHSYCQTSRRRRRKQYGVLSLTYAVSILPCIHTLRSVPGGGNLTFRGIKNLDATIEWAIAHGMDKATEFVLTGGSAGGLSTFLHADRVGAKVAAAAPGCSKIRAAPVVGYFLDHDNFRHTAGQSKIPLSNRESASMR